MWPLGTALRGGGSKPPRAAMAVAVVVSDRGKGALEVSGGDQEGVALKAPVPGGRWRVKGHADVPSGGHVVHRRTGRLPAATTTRNTASLLARMAGLLSAALDTEPWWRREEWNPVEDGRIPLREHEPMGRYTVRFGQITTGWLRAGAQWHCKAGLETGTLTWPSVHHRVCSFRELDRFLAGREVAGPALADGPAAVRALMREFLTSLRTRLSTRGRRAGKSLSDAAVARGRGHRAVLRAHGRQQGRGGRRAGRALGPEHHGFYRRRELPVPDRPPIEGEFISVAAMSCDCWNSNEVLLIFN